MKEKDIRPDVLMKDHVKYAAEDIKELLNHSQNFVEVPCPACNSLSSKEIFFKNGMHYVVCQVCETLFTNPRPTPQILEQYFAISKNYKYWNEVVFPASEKVRREKIFRPRAVRLAEICARYNIKRDTLLEVGSGFGTFCEEVKKVGLFKRVIAVEPSPDLAETCRKKGLEVIQKPIENIHLKKESVDVVVSFEVIEHLFSPREFIKSCASVLSPGGLLVISCPNMKGFDILILKELSESIDTEHLNYFNPTSLSNLVKSLGFDILEITTPGKLDAELVRKKILSKQYDISNNPFLEMVLLDRWEDVGAAFQQFLAENNLSSHLWLVGRKK